MWTNWHLYALVMQLADRGFHVTDSLAESAREALWLARLLAQWPDDGSGWRWTSPCAIWAMENEGTGTPLWLEPAQRRDSCCSHIVAWQPGRLLVFDESLWRLRHTNPEPAESGWLPLAGADADIELARITVA